MEARLQTRIAMWIALTLIQIMAAALQADDPVRALKKPGSESINQPGAVPLRRSEVDPHLENILLEWERAASGIQRFDCSFTRFRYDRHFDVERRGTGWLSIDLKGRAAYKIVPARIAPGQVSRKLSHRGEPFELKAEDCDRWHWTGTSVIRVNERERTYEEIVLPVGSPSRTIATRLHATESEFQPEPPTLPEDEQPSSGTVQAIEGRAGSDQPQCDAPTTRLERHLPSTEKSPMLCQWIAGVIVGMIIYDALSKNDFSALVSEFPIPHLFLVGTRAVELKRRFKIELVKETDSEVWLQFFPRWTQDSASFLKVKLILSADEYKPMAINVIDATGAETVHVFAGHIRGAGFLHSSPLDRPDLTGYRPLSIDGK